MSAMKILRLHRFFNVQNFMRCWSPTFRLEITNNHVRNYTSASEDAQAVEKMQYILQKRFPKAKKIIVNDMSGGCGSMYEIFVESVEFKGLPLVKQHMLINETLKEQIKDMHGLTVKTKIPDGS